MVLIGRSSDRRGERFWHVALPSLVGAAGFAASAYLQTPVPGMIALTVAAVGDLGSRGPFWSLPPQFLTGGALAAGIAVINTMGSLGGFVGPYAVGFVKDATGSFRGGMLFLAALLVASAVATLWLRRSPVLAGRGGAISGGA
jgi:ACS family tartrate transporter-like MFS transporter